MFDPQYLQRMPMLPCPATRDALQVGDELSVAGDPSLHADSLIATGQFIVLGLSRELTDLAPQAIRGMRQAVPSYPK